MKFHFDPASWAKENFLKDKPQRAPWKRVGSRPYLKSSLFSLAILALLYFFLLPPLNLRAQESYIFLFFALVLFSITHWIEGASRRQYSTLYQKGFFAIVALLLILSIGSMISAPIFHAKSYARILVPEDGVFAEDVAPANFSQLPIVDRSTAIKLGARKMGEMGELVSQYDIDQTYSQINIGNQPVRVTPLVYSNFLKWVTNMRKGIPYYISVDMSSQEATLNKLATPIRYSKSDKLLRDITRHLRFHYPTAIFGETNFEVDDHNHPYWITPILEPTIGLFGGRDVKGVLVCDAITGTINHYATADKNIPEWIDRVYPAELVLQQLTWYGHMQKGYWNQYFTQVGVIEPTKGYNYLSIGEDIYIYTGMTSVVADESNIGFVLINLRTKETKFYAISSAEEFSVMESAQGAVQEKGYRATFPILININNRPTYFLSLKDNADLTKMFSLIDAQSYTKVATGNTIEETLRNYKKLNAGMPIEGSSDDERITATIAAIYPVVVEGNTIYYIRMQEDPATIYLATISVSDHLPFLNPGDVVQIGGNGVGDTFTIGSLIPAGQPPATDEPTNTLETTEPLETPPATEDTVPTADPAETSVAPADQQ